MRQNEKNIDQTAAAVEAGATLVDVREVDEYVDGHVPGAKLVPMGQLPGRVDEFDRAESVYVICASGNRSSAMTDFLRGAGFDAWSVAGGTQAWVQSGRAVEGGL